MRSLVLVALLGAGCLSQLVPAHKQSQAQAPSVDMAEAPADPQMPAPTGGEDAAPTTTAEDAAPAPAPADGGGTTTLAAFGQPCATGADCQSGICQTIMQMLICTQTCTMLGVADPTCPNNGICNQNGYCKP